MIGKQFGPYQIVEEIGKGGMATVFRAYQPNMDRFVAVKVIRKSVLNTPTVLERFQREARLIARLEHPHLLPVYDFDGSHDPPYIVMRFVEGGTLREVRTHKQLPFEEVAYMIQQVSAALDYAHRQGITHRDIKPSNIMIDQEGNAFVADFGIARTESQAESAITQAGSLIGTPDYMSPEQCKGVGQVDSRADIYSLGVMLFEMATGRLPFIGDNPVATILSHVQEPVPSAVTLNPDLPPELDAVIRKSMAKDPEDRFQTINEFSSAVISVLQGKVAHTPVALRQAAQESMNLYMAKRSPKEVEQTLATFAASMETDPQGTPLTQNRQVTILYADLSEFAEILFEESGDNEAVNEKMSGLWDHFNHAIRFHGGKVDSRRGDIVTAFWGTDSTREDDPERAVRGALAMKQILRESAGDLLEEDEDLPIRIGINTGQVLISQNQESGEQQATGVAVNVANRLAQSSDGSVLVSHDTFRHIRGVFTIEEDSPIRVRGRAGRVAVYRVIAVKPRAFRLDTRVVEGVETRMIGRNAELEILRELTETVKEEGETQIVTVVGEAGSGKSRLLYEWLNWEELLPDDMWAFRGRATRDTMNVPYALIRDLFTFRFEIQDNDSPSAVREKFEKGVTRFMGEGNEETAHLIGQLTGFDFSDSPHLRGLLADPLQLHEKAVAAIDKFFRSLASDEENSIDITIEDMHWADDRSLDVINHLVEQNQDLYLLVICLARPELYDRRPQWGGGQEFHTRIDIRPLSRRSTRLLVKEVLKKVDVVPKELRDLVVERSEGNPFFIEELIKMLIEDRVIVKGESGDEGNWQVQMDRLAHFRVPPTLTGMIQARLDSLFPAERTLLQRASVIGRTFWDAALKSLSRADGFEIDTSNILKNLQDREMIYAREESAFQGSVEYIFGNNMSRDVIYESILKRQRSAYHARMANWLIEVSGDRADEYNALIAQHYESAGDKLKAVEYLSKAGEKATFIGAYHEAITFFERGLALIEKSSDKAGKTCKASLLRQLGIIYEDLGQRARAVEDLEASLEIARELKDSQATLEALNILGQVTGKWGKFSEAEAYLEEALALAEKLDDKRGQAFALMWFGAHHSVQENFDDANQYLNKALPLAQETGDDVLTARTLNILGECARYQDDLQGALELYQKAGDIYQRIGNHFGDTLVTCNLGHVAAALGENDKGRGNYLKALESGMTIGAVPLTLEALAGLAGLLASEGESSEALRLASLAITHPLTDVDTIQFAKPIMDKLKKEMAADAFSAASEEGKALDLTKVVSDLGKRLRAR